MGNRISRDLAAALQLCLVPILVERGIALEIERFRIGFAQTRIEDELRRRPRVAHALCLGERHVITHAMLRLTGGEALQEYRSAILQAIENGPQQFGWVRNRDLRDKR